MTNPPTPRRCRRILEAHHLDCQGLSPNDIATQLRCARSTVYAYFRDFQTHRAHILRTVAADRLADQVHILTTPETDPDQHRQTVAATRELRLLLAAMPDLQEQERQQREQLVNARQADAVALAQSRHFLAGEDGHVRYISRERYGQCLPECPMCRPELYEGDDPLPPLRSPHEVIDADLEEPAPTEPEPDQPSQNPDPSAPIQTNLDKSGHQNEENTVQDTNPPANPPEFTPNPAISPNQTPKTPELAHIHPAPTPQPKRRHPPPRHRQILITLPSTLLPVPSPRGRGLG